MSVENPQQKNNDESISGEVIEEFDDYDLAILIADKHGVPIEVVQAALDNEGTIVNYTTSQDGEVHIESKNKINKLIKRIRKFFI